MTKDTMKNKSQLAKLLATENIEVQENQVQTASFDVVNRILTIPIFKEEQKSKIQQHCSLYLNPITNNILSYFYSTLSPYSK